MTQACHNLPAAPRQAPSSPAARPRGPKARVADRPFPRLSEAFGGQSPPEQCHSVAVQKEPPRRKGPSGHLACHEVVGILALPATHWKWSSSGSGAAARPAEGSAWTALVWTFNLCPRIGAATPRDRAVPGAPYLLARISIYSRAYTTASRLKCEIGVGARLSVTLH